MSRTDYFDLDLEGLGCGRFVDGDDPDAWARALEEVLADAPAMGRRGRAFAEQHWNDQTFAAGLTAVLDRVTAAG